MQRDRTHVLSQGLAAGVIGYAAVALFLLAVDLLSGRPAFYTPALLGEMFFYGLADPAQATVWPGPVLAFNGCHLLLFLALGMVASWLATMSERGPGLWFAGLFAFLFVLFHVQGMVLLLAAPAHQVLSTWTLIAGGILAAVAMAASLVALHPRLAAQLRQVAD